MGGIYMARENMAGSLILEYVYIVSTERALLRKCWLASSLERSGSKKSYDSDAGKARKEKN